MVICYMTILCISNERRGNGHVPSLDFKKMLAFDFCILIIVANISSDAYDFKFKQEKSHDVIMFIYTYDMNKK